MVEERKIVDVPQPLEVWTDTIGEKLDEMADLCEYWKRHRGAGRNPNAVRTALLMLASEVTILATNAEKSIWLKTENAK